MEKSAKGAGAAVEAIGKSNGAKRLGKEVQEAATGAKRLGKEVQGAATGAKRLGKETQAARGMDGVSKAAQAAEQGLGNAANAGRRVKDALTAADRQALGLQRHMQGVALAVRGAAGQMRTFGRGVKTAYSTAGGLAAAGYIVKSAAQKPVDYEHQLASMANVAYADRDATGRKAGMAELDAAIVKAVRQGGGKREDAAATLNTMLASGEVDESTAKDKLLPVIQRGSTASGASGKELANILLKGISQKQFTADEAQLALDKALKSGEMGQFELKDMAKWLPNIISAGKGMQGMSGFDAHLANLQGVAKVTGNNEQAGNAYFNLLSKITSQDATTNFKKFKINLPKALATGVLKGQDTVTAFVDLVQTMVVNKDKNFKALQKKIAATSDNDERRALMEKAADVLQGTAVGKVIQDREAMLGLVGVMTQQDTIKKVREKLQHAQGSTQTSYDVIASTGAYQQEQLANERDIATSGLYNRVKNPANAAMRKVTSLAQDNPVAAQTVVGGATAGTAAAAAGAANSLLGGGSASAGAAKGLLTASEFAARNAPALMLLGAGLKVYNTATDQSLSGAQKKINNMETYGQLGGALGGMAMGAAAGSWIPVLGNIAGAILGGLMGYFAGGKAGHATGQLAWGDEAAAQQSKPQDAVIQAAQIIQQQPINATIKLDVNLDGDKVAAAVEQRQLRESTRH